MILLFIAEVRTEMRTPRERLVLALDLIAEDIQGLPEDGVSLIRQKKDPIKRIRRTHQRGHYEIDVIISRCFIRVWWRIR
jgi:hypothetical protein